MQDAAVKRYKMAAVLNSGNSTSVLAKGTAEYCTPPPILLLETMSHYIYHIVLYYCMLLKNNGFCCSLFAVRLK